MAKHAWKVIVAALAVVIGLLLLGGPASEKPAEPPGPVQAEAPKIQPRKTVGKTTQTVLDLADAIRQGGVRTVYFAILISHIFLAVAVPVLAIAMFVLAWKGRWNAHRRLGRVALPIWLYVSVTGVVIYLMLYHFFPGPAHASTLNDIQDMWSVASVSEGG